MSSVVADPPAENPEAVPDRRRSWWRLRRVWATPPALLVLAVAAFLVHLYTHQRDLIYLPTRMAPAEFEAAVRALPEGRTSVIDPFDAVVVEPPRKVRAKGTAILFHGNSGVGLDRAELVPLFLNRGFRLVIAEYPGYGARDGAPTEQALVADANALYAEVAKRFREGPILLVGESLGTGVAVQVAADQSQNKSARAPSRLVLLTPFVSMAETASRLYWYLPVRPLVHDVFDSAMHILNYRGPVAILAAGQDEIVGAEQGRQLADLARSRGETVYLELEDAKHSRSSVHLTDDQVNSLLGFVPKVAKVRAKPTLVSNPPVAAETPAPPPGL